MGDMLNRRMKSIGSLIVLLLWSMMSPNTAIGSITVTARVDRNRVTIFERINYSIQIDSDSRKIPEPSFPVFKGFRQLGSPRTSSQMSWVNGVVSNSQTYMIVIEAREEGSFTFEPAKVVMDGRVIQSAPVTVTVVKPGASTPDGDDEGGMEPDVSSDRLQSLFLQTVVENETPYVGEAVRVSYHVFTRVSIRDFGIQDEPEYQGFWVEPVDLPAQTTLHSRTIQGIEYGEASIHEVVLYPTVSGELVIPPLVMVFQIQDRRQDPFDNFFNSPFRSSVFGTRQETRSSQTKIIHAKPLPEDGKPLGFSGAAGDFKLEASIRNHSVKVGEAITINVILSGNHGLKTIGSPVPPELPKLKVFEPKAEDAVQDPETPGWWRRTYEYVLVAHEPGELTIPGFSFSYFDTETETYKILKTKDFSVSVAPAPAGEQPLSYSSSGREMKIFNIDVQYIKTGNNLKHQVPVYSNKWFGIAMTLPIIIVPVILLIDSRRRRLEGDSVFAREVRARSESSRRFSEAVLACKEDDYNRALDAAATGFSRYLADRLGLPTGGITWNSILKEIDARSVKEPIIEQVKDYWQDLETARYGPVQPSPDAVGNLINKGRNLVDKLEKTRMNPKKGSANKRRAISR
ncbi:protein BatD [bacterium]|nr:protein BatD [candidate division CSSED10-310 bacterium]